MRIYLIGLPGCGKSTIGKKLAKELNYTFIDLDEYIEKKACLFLDEIFELYGEEYFRKLESSCLNEMKKFPNAIISTGGGIIKDKNNKKLTDGKCIFLDVAPAILSKRIEEQSNIRPLLKSKSIFDLYNERIELYNYFMDYKINNIDEIKTIKEIIAYAKGISD